MIQCLAPTAVPLVPNAVHLAQHHKTRETQDSTYAAEPANSIDSHRAAADPYDTIKSVFCSDAQFTATPPRLAVSPLGDSVVTMGAVRSALDFVEKETLDIELRHS